MIRQHLRFSDNICATFTFLVNISRFQAQFMYSMGLILLLWKGFASWFDFRSNVKINDIICTNITSAKPAQAKKIIDSLLNPESIENLSVEEAADSVAAAMDTLSMVCATFFRLYSPKSCHATPFFELIATHKFTACLLYSNPDNQVYKHYDEHVCKHVLTVWNRHKHICEHVYLVYDRRGKMLVF